MKKLLIYLAVLALLLLPFLAAAQDTSLVMYPAALATATEFSGTAPTYNGTLRNISDLYGTGYAASSIDAGDRYIDAAGRIYSIDVVTARGLDTLAATLTALDSIAIAPSGSGVAWPVDTSGIIPVMPWANGMITPVLAARVLNHNLSLAVNSGGTPLFTTDTFNLNQPTLRTLTTGVTIGGNSFSDWASWHYFAPPTMSLSGSSPTNEVGTSVAYTFTNTTSNPGIATLSNGRIEKNGASQVTFGAATTGTYNYTFAPTGVVTETIISRQDWIKGGESGTAASASRTLRGVYPVLYGVSATDYSTSGNVYDLTKLVTTEGNKTVNMDGSGFIYYAVPVAWTDEFLSSIIDGNGFNVTPSFTAYTVSVSSSGLVNNWTVDYRLYKLNTLTTVDNSNYVFNR